MWAGWLWGSATSGHGICPGPRAPVADNQVFHIVESVDMEKMGEETPTDNYYDRLNEDMGKRRPQAGAYLLDHLLSLQSSRQINRIRFFFRCIESRHLRHQLDASLGGAEARRTLRGAKL